MSSAPVPSGESHWKNPDFLAAWKKERKEQLEIAWGEKWKPDWLEDLKDDAEPVSPGETADLEDRPVQSTAARKRLPHFIGMNDDGEIVFAPAVEAVAPHLPHKARALFECDLTVKANRYLACKLLAAPVRCRNGHSFYVRYRCGLRYCEECGPTSASRVFAQYFDRLLGVAIDLLGCGDPNCEACRHALTHRAKGSLPHWPPQRGKRPRTVVAKLDFTLENTGELPTPELIKRMNRYIKRFFRLVEKRFGISRREYGVAYCDELGCDNTNLHAHAVYVGPWLPQERKEISNLWAEVTGYYRRRDALTPAGKIVSIKYAQSFAKALFHAVKYPAKFAAKLGPERFANLEWAFHRVRRFHTLARFYNAPKPPEPECTGLSCPICDDLVPARFAFFTSLVATLRKIGYVETKQAYQTRAKVAVLTPDP